jgi:sucrose-6-phosphate hydrolase SacC (GH32 family)
LGAETLDVDAEFEPDAKGEITFTIRGNTFTWVADKFTGLDRSMPLAPVNGRLKLRLLVDRTSIEVFGNDGAVAMSSCFLPKGAHQATTLSVNGSYARCVSFRPQELKSAWPQQAGAK